MGSRPGKTNGRTVLTRQQVAEIRTKHIKGKNQYDGNTSKLAREYGVHPSTVLAIVNRKHWGR